MKAMEVRPTQHRNLSTQISGQRPYKTAKHHINPRKAMCIRKSTGFKQYPHGCNEQIKRALTINPWDHPRDKVSNRCHSGTIPPHPLR